MDTQITITVVSAAIGLVVWAAQRMWERCSQLRERKQKHYEALVASVVDLHLGNAAPTYVESQPGWLFASDEVLDLIDRYFKATAEKSPGPELLALLGQLLLAMRKDIGIRTRLSREWAEKCYLGVGPPKEAIDEYRTRAKKEKAEKTDNN